MSGKPAK